VQISWLHPFARQLLDVSGESCGCCGLGLYWDNDSGIADTVFSGEKSSAHAELYDSGCVQHLSPFLSKFVRTEFRRGNGEKANWRRKDESDGIREELNNQILTELIEQRN
jgi:hypothetical protein